MNQPVRPMDFETFWRLWEGPLNADTKRCEYRTIPGVSNPCGKRVTQVALVETVRGDRVLEACDEHAVPAEGVKWRRVG